MKRCIATILAVLLCFSVFAAGTTEQEGSAKPVTMRFSWWGGEARHKGTLAVIDLYAQRNPKVTIEGEYSGWDGYYKKLVTQLAGGTAPDIMQIDQPWVFDLSSKGDVFAPLEVYGTLDLSGFDPQFLKDYCSYDGKIIGLPTGLNGEVLLLDRDVMKKVGIDEATKWTWKNIVVEGKKVNAYSPDMYFLNDTPKGLAHFLEKYLAQKGGEVVNPDKTLGFSEDDAQEAFTYFQTWFDEKILPPFSETVPYNSSAEENPAWLNSRMVAMRSWTSNMDKIKAGKTNMMVTSLPILEGAKNTGVTIRPSQLLAINANSESKEAAADFLGFFFNDQEALTTLGTIRGVPPTSGARSLLKSKDMLDPLIEEATDIALSVLGRPQTVWQMNSEVQEILIDVTERFGYGMLTPKQAAHELVVKLNAKLATL